METTNLTSTTSSTVTSSSTSESQSSSEATISSDFDTFLTLLTAQIKHQDPLDPVDSENFASQLAEFSNVEQAVLTNDLLKEISAKLVEDETSNYASMIGMEIRTPGPFDYAGSPLTLNTDIPENAFSATLEIFDRRGDKVGELALDPEADEVSWDGNTNSGTSLSNGTYNFETVATTIASDGTTFETRAPVESGYSLVTEARLGNGDVTLYTASGDSFTMDEVTAIRTPESS